MARHLKTGWVVIATSGSVVHGAEDGRFIKKEWLQDMAETFNTKVFTPQLWPDHNRFFSSFGKVVALKTEQVNEGELKGELQLFAILSPNDSLISANRAGQYTFPSIEVGENFRGTGKYFLKGLGVTEEPASAGVAELNFSKNGKAERAIVIAGEQFNVNEHLEEGEKESLWRRIFSTHNTDNEPPTDDEETPMDTKQLETMSANIEEMKEAMLNFSKLLAGAEGAGGGEGGEGGEGGQKPAAKTGETVSAEEFNTLKKQFADLKAQLGAGGEDEGEGAGGGEGKTVVTAEQFTKLQKQFEKLSNDFNAALNEEQPGTQGGSPTGDTFEEVL